eukprot:m.25809 g.25809  ORF g.25809 m.25809 type:complete len:76 (-) comp11629_c0_seq2:332-559(-)
MMAKNIATFKPSKDAQERTEINNALRMVERVGVELDNNMGLGHVVESITPHSIKSLREAQIKAEATELIKYFDEP